MELEECVLCSLEAPVVVYVNVNIVFLALGVNECVLFIMPLQIHVKDRHIHINNLANVCFQIVIINQLCTPLV